MRTKVTPALVALSRPFGSVQREMDDLFEHFFHVPTANGNSKRAYFASPAEVWEEDGVYHVDLDMPGMASDDVQVTFEDRTLNIRAERRQVESNKKYLYTSRSYGVIENSLTLPPDADGDSIEANLANGVLHVTIKKRPELQSKKINVKTN
jgi:HSP20 family protein